MTLQFSTVEASSDGSIEHGSSEGMTPEDGFKPLSLFWKAVTTVFVVAPSKSSPGIKMRYPPPIYQGSDLTPKAQLTLRPEPTGMKKMMSTSASGHCLPDMTTLASTSWMAIALT